MSPSASDGEQLPQRRPPLVVIANPENRRVTYFREAASRLGLPPPREIAWLDILSRRVSLVDAIPASALVRIDSPGENADVETALIELGASISLSSRAPTRRLEHGEIGHSRLWQAGLTQVLEEIQSQLEPLGVSWMNHPAEIPFIFDKANCQSALHRAGFPTPLPLASPTTYEHLREIMRLAGKSRVFAKLRFGSSASGVVALEASPRGVRATTSVELVEVENELRLFNSLRVQTYDDERRVAILIDELCRQRVYLETWLPKAGWRGTTFDLRIVVIAGRARHVVMRTSRGPITNLHLGNKRGDVEAFLAELPAPAREAAWLTCERVARVFPSSLYFGIDLLFLPGFRRHALIEVNAFGDLLPGVTHEGDDTYTAELRAALSTSRRLPRHDHS